jgi:hypothetical protein
MKSSDLNVNIFSYGILEFSALKNADASRIHIEAGPVFIGNLPDQGLLNVLSQIHYTPRRNNDTHIIFARLPKLRKNS